MNIIIRTILVLNLFYLHGFLQAQSKKNTDEHLRYGVTGGVQFQNISLSEGEKNDLLLGFNGGISVAIPIAPEFYVQSGLLYSLKGAKGKETILGTNYNRTVKISYIELPINFVYKPSLGNGRIILGVGPYVAFGINGNQKYDAAGIEIKKDIKFQNSVSISDPIDKAYLRPLDSGINLLAGYEINRNISIQLNTQLGLLNIFPKYDFITDNVVTGKNTGFGISLGYTF